MTLEELYYVSQIVAAIAIFLSLIFVGLQMRQSARNQRAVMHANRTASIRESMQLMGEPAMARVLAAGAAASTDMDPLEINQFVFFVRSTFSGMQHQYLEWREGLIDDARWNITRTALESQFVSPGHRAVYLMWRDVAATPEFREMCNAMFERNDGKLPVDQVAIWRTLAAQQRERTSLASTNSTALPGAVQQ